MPVTLLRPLCTVDEVRAELGNTQSDIEDKLKTAINSASRFLERVTVRDWVLHDYTTVPLVLRKQAVVSAFLDGELFLPTPPVVLLTSLTEDGVLLVEHDDFEIDLESGCVKRIGASWGSVVTFVGKLGYLTADATTPAAELPGNLRTGVAKIAAAWSGEMRRENVGFDGKKIQLSDKRIPADAYDLICPFVVTNL